MTQTLRVIFSIGILIGLWLLTGDISQEGKYCLSAVLSFYVLLVVYPSTECLTK